MWTQSLALLLLTAACLVSYVAATNCKAMCYLDKSHLLACTLRTALPDPKSFSQPVRCVKKEYGTSTEVIIGGNEEVDGVAPGGFDVFAKSEAGTASTASPLQLTLILKLKMLGPGLFGALTNLRRLEARPLDVHPCALYDLPPSVREVLLQCVGPKMKMLSPMQWPSDSAVQFKLNMCIQDTRCYTCPGGRPVELRSKASGPLRLNSVVSLKECISSPVCNTKGVTCATVPTTTTTTKPTTIKKKKKSVVPDHRPTPKTDPRRSPSRSKSVMPVSGDGIPPSKREWRLEREERRENFLLLAVASATAFNTFILVLILIVLFYAASCCCCCKKKSRGVFFISKDNYPPEYSTLRPV